MIVLKPGLYIRGEHGELQRLDGNRGVIQMVRQYNVASGDLVEVLGDGTEKDEFSEKWAKEIKSRLRMKGTGWRIPTRCDWMNLIAINKGSCDWPESYNCVSWRDLANLISLNRDGNYWAIDGRDSYITGSSEDGSLIFVSDHDYRNNRIRLVQGEEVDKSLKKKAELITR